MAKFDSNWDVNNLLKEDGIANKLLKDGKMKDLELLMDYTKMGQPQTQIKLK